MKVQQQNIECPTDTLHEAFLKTKDPSEKAISQQKIAKDSESLYFPKNGDENDGRIGHALNIADIWSENVKYLQELADF